MSKSEHLVDEVLDQDTNHPDLLVSDRTTLSFVHSISTEGRHEALLLIVDHGFVQVDELCLVGTIHGRRWVPNLAENRTQRVKVLLEECMQLVEVGDSARHCLHQLVVRLDHILLAIVTAVKSEKLEV